MAGYPYDPNFTGGRFTPPGGGGGGGGGGGFGISPLALGLGALGIGGGLWSGIRNQGISKKLMDEQLRMARQQRDVYQQNIPGYEAALRQYAGMAGLPGYGDTGAYAGGRVGAMRNAPNQYQGFTPTGSPGGNWNLGALDTQAMQARRAAAEEDLAQQTANADARYRQQAGLMGLSTGAQAAGLAQQHEQALQNYAGYRRGLAMQAGDIEAQRLGQYMGALGPSFGQGAQASATLGGQGAYYGNLAQQGYGAAGQALGGLEQYGMMNQYLQHMPGMYGMGGYGIPGMGMPGMGGYLPPGMGMYGQQPGGVSNYGITRDAQGNPVF